ncbi:MAG: DUF975 family protein [Firmicutes bacterium]|nr:DUF975 family protein [Bacillota bacterium]
MWTREELKLKAKSVLKNTYWKAFVASIVLSIATGGGPSFGSSIRTGKTNNQFINIDTNILFPIFAVIAIFAAGAIIFSIILTVFVGAPLEVGAQKFFVKNQQEDSNLKYLGAGFAKETYLKVVLTIFLRNLYIFLWTLLFIIPGIVKSYAYSMVPYILSENPGMNTAEAINLSEKMTKGHKADIFVLDLSFIGWILLGVLACGIGVIFVLPYIYATKAELYLKLKEIALVKGIANTNEFIAD